MGSWPVSPPVGAACHLHRGPALDPGTVYEPVLGPVFPADPKVARLGPAEAQRSDRHTVHGLGSRDPRLHAPPQLVETGAGDNAGSRQLLTVPRCLLKARLCQAATPQQVSQWTSPPSTPLVPTQPREGAGIKVQATQDRYRPPPCWGSSEVRRGELGGPG